MDFPSNKFIVFCLELHLPVKFLTLFFPRPFQISEPVRVKVDQLKALWSGRDELGSFGDDWRPLSLSGTSCNLLLSLYTGLQGFFIQIFTSTKNIFKILKPRKICLYRRLVIKYGWRTFAKRKTEPHFRHRSGIFSIFSQL